MEATREKGTDYVLVEEFMQHLLTLDSSQLMTFYCETCHDRLGTPIECCPSSPFQENTGTCSHCDRIDDVSNPEINRFLNKRILTLEYCSGLIRVVPEVDETTTLIRDWLIPNDYAFLRHRDSSHGEESSFTWTKYGRKQEKQLYRSSTITQESKSLLLPFYPLCYSLVRFTPEPVKKPEEETSKETALNLVDEFLIPVSESNGQPVSERSVLSTFGRFKAFVASIPQRWNVKSYEKGI